MCWYAWKQKKLRLPDLCKKTKLSKNAPRYHFYLSAVPFGRSLRQDPRNHLIHFPVNLFSANGERPVRTTFHFWFRLYSSQGIVLWDTCHLAPADGSLQRLTRKMLSCSLLFSDPFFLLNTLHYSLIFRFVKQF